MKKAYIYITFLILATQLSGQEKVALSGYLNDMQTVYRLGEDNWIWENQLHRRLNFSYYPASWLSFTIQERTRFLQGNTYSKFPGYGSMLGADPGWIDLSFIQSDNYNDDVGYVYSMVIDRAYAEFTFGNFVGTVGRQRINWGQTFAWNPNDIFNTYSYFDVDYPERPGSDAIRLQYYTSMTSTIEVAAKIDSANKVTAAYYSRFNVGSYDIQVLGGILSEEDIVAGIGWSGNIVNTSFRGELSYFRNMHEFRDTSGYFLVSAGLDYSFGNSLWLQAEVLYSEFAKDRNVSNLMQLFSSDMSVKNLGFTEWSIFGSVSYPISPLVNTTLSGIYFPEWKGFYIGPNVEISLSDNISASIIIQAFSAELEDFSGEKTRQNTYIAYARLKWSF